MINLIYINQSILTSASIHAWLFVSLYHLNKKKPPGQAQEEPPQIKQQGGHHSKLFLKKVTTLPATCFEMLTQQ